MKRGRNRYHAICLWHGDLGERSLLRRVRGLARQHRRGSGLAPACRHPIGILHVTRDTIEGVTSHVLERL